MLALKPYILYRKPVRATLVIICGFSDAAHPKDRDYGQTGMVTDLRISTKAGGVDIFHSIDWTCQKQKHVSYSPYGAEILAVRVGDDLRYYYKTAINHLFPKYPIRHDLNIDGKGLRETLVTIHEGKDYRLGQTVQRIRDSFESHELGTIHSIPGTENVSDASTKRNLTL